MKLVKQARLAFQEGSSDKVYEVDLCELSAGRYLVNFRYGRRGSVLKDGTKTPVAVPLAEAEAVYDDLVAEKTKKGYRDQGAPAAPAAVPPTPKGLDPEARARAVLARLALAVPAADAPGGGRVAAIDDAVPPGGAPPAAASAPPAAPAPAPGAAPKSEPLSGLMRLWPFSRKAAGPDAPASAAGAAGAAGAGARGAAGTRGAAGGPVAAGARAGDAAEDAATWPLDRAIWRAGELRLAEAVPMLLALLAQKPAGKPERRLLRDHAIAAALGRIGDPRAVPALAALFKDARTPPAVRRMAREALPRLTPPALLAEFSADEAATLPDALRVALEAGEGEALAEALAAHLASPPGHRPGPGAAGRHQVIETLYLIDTPAARHALLAWLRKVPLAPPAFQRIRHLYKAAEYRNDGEVFGVIARRIETSRPGYKRTSWGWVEAPAAGPEAGDRLDMSQEDARAMLASPGSRIAFGPLTREYLRLRSARALRRLGDVGDAAGYVAMAAGVLAAFTDHDAQAPRQGHVPWSRRGRAPEPRRWDAYAPYHAFNWVLYRHSPRYERRGNRKQWSCAPGWKPGDAVPAEREEAFPSLWDAHPEALMGLLAASRCAPVHEFAARALRANPAYLAGLDRAAIATLLRAPYGPTAELGFDLARQRWEASAGADLGLLGDVLAGGWAPGREAAMGWARAAGRRVAEEAWLLAALVANPWPDVRAFALDWLATLPVADPRPAIALVLADAAGAPAKGEALDDARLRAAGEAIRRLWPEPLRALSLDVLHDLLAHPRAAVREVGAGLLLAHGTPPAEWPASLLATLVGSPDAALRETGALLYGRLTAAEARGRLDEVAALAWHARADVRAAIRPALARWAGEDPALAAGLASRLLARLQAPARDAAIPDGLAAVLAEDHAAWLAALPAAPLVALALAEPDAARRLGGRLLAERPQLLAGLPAADLVALADHEAVALRTAAWAAIAAQADRLRADPAEERRLTRWLDAQWDDARAAAFAFFRAWPADAWTPSALVAIAESPRDDVQAFARERITHAFRSEDGETYLLALSEHPSAAMQGFASAFLADHAADDPARLAQLAPFFVTVLSRVNKGRVAKRRVLDFLAAEAAKREDAARVVVGVLERQAATMAIGDRARAIATLNAIRRAWPDLPGPLAVHEPALRGEALTTRSAR